MANFTKHILSTNATKFLLPKEIQHQNAENFYQQELNESDSDNFATMLYLSYMPICCLIGLTGNAMVWVLIRYSNIMFYK